MPSGARSTRGHRSDAPIGNQRPAASGGARRSAPSPDWHYLTCDLYDAGLTIEAIAEQAGLSRDGTALLLERLGGRTAGEVSGAVRLLLALWEEVGDGHCALVSRSWPRTAPARGGAMSMTAPVRLACSN